MGSIKVKTLLLCFALSALCFKPVKAQTFAEWFSQGKTQIKYLVQQIAALNAFETSMRQGYNMLHSEWTTIGNFKNGEFGLHQSYYTSLSNVNPIVKNSINLADVQSQQQSIISQFKTIQHLSGLLATEQTYIGLVQHNVINQCAKDLTDLQAVLTSGNLVMTDDERLKQLEKIKADMLDKYQFTQSFCNTIRLMIAQRNQETNQKQTLKQLYGIP